MLTQTTMAQGDSLVIAGNTLTVTSLSQALNTDLNRYDVTVGTADGSIVCGADELVLEVSPGNLNIVPTWVYSGTERVPFYN